MTQAAFKPGARYMMRWITNADMVTPCLCVKRTAKFVTFDVENFGIKRCAIRTRGDGYEYALPLGTYSMAPAVSAERILRAV